MKLSSLAFKKNGTIPTQFTCDMDRFHSPALHIDGVPPETQSLVLIMDDPDVPRALMSGGLFTHWVMFNIPPDTRIVPEGEHRGTLGLNTRGELKYTGPCPPPDYEPSTHRYIFKLTALDATLPLLAGASREDVEQAMGGHEIAFAEYSGLYKRI